MEIKSIDNTKFYLPATMTTQNKSSKNMLHQKTIKEQLKHNSNNYSTGEKLIAGAGVIVLIAGIIKGKSIIKLFKNSKIETNLNSEMQIVTTGKNKNNGHTTLYFPEPTKEQLLKHYENLQEQQGTYAVRLENKWTKEDKDKYREVTNILVSVEKQIQRRNISTVTKKDISEFSTDESFRKAQIRNYMHQFVYPKTSTNEASALDVLDLYEKFGEKNDKGRIGTTMFSLALDLARLPKSHKTEKLLSKYLDVTEKIGEKGVYDDAHSVAVTLTSFIRKDNPNNISDDSVLRAVNMIKTYAQGDKKVKFVYNSVLKSKYNENPKISDAIKELLEQIRDKSN